MDEPAALLKIKRAMGLSDEDLQNLASELLAIRLLCSKEGCEEEVVQGYARCKEHLPRGACGACGRWADFDDYLCSECRSANDLADSL